jgi:O-antigen ligase
MNLALKLKLPDFYILSAMSLFLFLQLIGLEPFPEVNYGRDLTDTGLGNALRQILFLALFLIAIILAGIGRHSRTHLIFDNKLILFLATWFLMSFLWSDESAITIRRAILFLIVCIVPIALCSAIGFRNFIKTNAKVLAVFMSISILSCLLINGAIHRGEVLDEALNGAWRGVFGHKNNAAIIAAMSGFIFLYQFLEERRKTWLILFCMAVFFLFLTKSKTTMSLFIPILIFSWFLSNHGSIKYYWLVISLISLVVPVSFLIGFDEVNSYLIDNPELFTGRGVIWQVLLEAISDNPIFGLGYGSVWAAGEFSAITDYGVNTSAWVANISHGHNGYLDLWVTSGIVGVVLFAMLLFKTFKEICYVPGHSTNDRFLCLSILMFLILHNFLESSFAVYSNPGWYFFLFAYCLKFKKAGI